jgi:hypothetical protein
MVNQTVETPIGKGVVQGRYAITDGGMIVAIRPLVRLVINDATVEHLSDPNCLTPRATGSALFTFTDEEVRYG